MTTRAHNTKRAAVQGGSLKRHMSSSASGHARSLYEELHPEMFKTIPYTGRDRRHFSKPPRTAPPPIFADDIRAYLAQHGNATSPQIAAALNMSTKLVSNKLTRGLVGIVRVGTQRTKHGHTMIVWGLVDIHTDDDVIIVE